LQTVLFSVLVIGGLGLVFGLLIAVVSKKFAVETDERVTAITGHLPGANCGGCGYAGCEACAKAIVSGEAAPNVCTVADAEATKAIGRVMGIEVEANEKMRAYVACHGTHLTARAKFIYEGMQDCLASTIVAGGPKDCQYGCIGLGTCEHACAFGAITIGEDGIAHVDRKKCTGCGVCVKACPRKVIMLVPESRPVRVSCRALDRGKQVKDRCAAGCIGCGMCVKACAYGAIEMKDFLPVIDYTKCHNCGKCTVKCPVHAISAEDASGHVIQLAANE